MTAPSTSDAPSTTLDLPGDGALAVGLPPLLNARRRRWLLALLANGVGRALMGATGVVLLRWALSGAARVEIPMGAAQIAAQPSAVARARPAFGKARFGSGLADAPPKLRARPMAAAAAMTSGKGSANRNRPMKSR